MSATQTKDPGETYWKERHEQLGCVRCKKADPQALGKGPCCLHPLGSYENQEGSCENCLEEE